jgi:serine/threonine-protein kinase
MPESVPAASKTPESVPARSDDQVTRLALRLVAANARLSALAIVTVIALIVLGAWVYSGVQQSLRDMRSAGLQTLLAAEVEALAVWIDDRRVSATHWAGEAAIRRDVLDLLQLVRTGQSGGDALWSAPARVRLQEALQPALKQMGAVAFNVVDPSGLIIATQVREYAGKRISPGSFLVHLARVFKGTSSFIRPYSEPQRIADLEKPAFEQPVIWFDAPVRDPEGRVVAALGFAHYAHDQFAHILNAAQLGRTGETYAFDESGTMLSESRFVDALVKTGLIPQSPQATAILRVQLRDPGGDLAGGHVPALELAARPLTRLAALAIASREKADRAQREGVLLEPYRNYRGTEVIGAWRWLSDHHFGVAAEMEASEAYAPLRYITLAFTLLLVLLGSLLLAALWSAFRARRLRAQVGDARVLGQYRLERELGEGGMAKVYLARHALLKRPTAVKMLKPHMATDEIIARFEREVQLASQLAHPNAVEIYDYGRTSEGVFYYVMEYLEGETLDRLVHQHGPMPLGRAVYVLKQVCAALREAHSRSLVHRDIKPHNIMLCHRGAEYDVVKLLDFGLVKDTVTASTRDITQYQKVLGTPRYMAPERIRNPADADARSDIYSVGAVAYFLVTGHELFETASEHDLAYQTQHTPAPRLTDTVPDVPRRLDDLVARCLSKDRRDRPHDVVIVLALLEALAVDFPWSHQNAEAWWRRRSKTSPAGAPV